MNNNNNGKKIVFLVVLFFGFMVFTPLIFIGFVDDFMVFMLIPIITVVMMMGFFFFMFFVSKSNVEKQQRFQRDGYQTNDRHCIQCHEQISTTDTYCPECGAEQTSYIICDYCGHKNDKHYLQCTKCNALIK